MLGKSPGRLSCDYIVVTNSEYVVKSGFPCGEYKYNLVLQMDFGMFPENDNLKLSKEAIRV